MRPVPSFEGAAGAVARPRPSIRGPAAPRTRGGGPLCGWRIAAAAQVCYVTIHAWLSRERSPSPARDFVLCAGELHRCERGVAPRRPSPAASIATSPPAPPPPSRAPSPPHPPALDPLHDLEAPIQHWRGRRGPTSGSGWAPAAHLRVGSHQWRQATEVVLRGRVPLGRDEVAVCRLNDPGAPRVCPSAVLGGRRIDDVGVSCASDMAYPPWVRLNTR